MKTIMKLYLAAFLLACYLGAGLAIAETNATRFQAKCPGAQHGPAWLPLKQVTAALWPFYTPILALDLVANVDRICDRFGPRS